MQLSNHFMEFSSPHTFLKSLHHNDVLLDTPLCNNLHHLPSLQNDPFSHKIYLHLPNKALLNKLISLILNPPWLLGQQIFFQLTQTIFHLPSLQPQKEIPLEINQLINNHQWSFKKG